MHTDLVLARKKAFQLMVENLKNLAEQFEAHRAYVNASADILTGTSEPLPDYVDIEGLDLDEILRIIAQRRLEQHPMLREAAESLGVDTRTLKRYAEKKRKHLLDALKSDGIDSDTFTVDFEFDPTQ
ncbi:hypothetical protein C6503_03475 [Candidatus Poribacteria bacterium]|nr:MAG: hypothetical protein C6503_03475 [Candidatus Poribacteria bacterium]